MHHDVHHAHSGCYIFQAVKFCGKVRGFVFDLPISELDSNYECDPNIAFKVKREAKRREDGHKKQKLGVEYLVTAAERRFPRYR